MAIFNRCVKVYQRVVSFFFPLPGSFGEVKSTFFTAAEQNPTVVNQPRYNHGHTRLAIFDIV